MLDHYSEIACPSKDEQTKQILQRFKENDKVDAEIVRKAVDKVNFEGSMSGWWVFGSDEVTKEVVKFINNSCHQSPE